MGEREYSMLRNLLLLVIVLLVVSVGSDVYLGRAMAENSRVFGKIYVLLESGLNEQFLSAMTQASAIEKKLAEANAHASEIDTRMKTVFKEAEDSMTQRLKTELPLIMDDYLKSRREVLRQEMAREEMRQVIRQELGNTLREEVRRQKP